MPPVRSLVAEKLKLEVYASREAMGQAAAAAAAACLRELAAQRERVAVIFATGASQIATLDALTAIPDLPWRQIIGFHMDEYCGIPEDSPASFRRFLQERLASRVKMRAFHWIDGNATDRADFCRRYAGLLRDEQPQLCLLGIGENGHLAFNDPDEADFADPLDMKLVTLDTACRRQQVNEGWFPCLDAVPPQAMTLTIPALLRVPRLIASVPGERKAQIVARSLREEISTRCPATILRTHAQTTVYLDPASAASLPQ